MKYVNNMATWDRGLRIAVSLVILALAVTGTISGILMYILLVVAAVFTITSVSGFCPLYPVLGFKTKKNNHKD